MARLPFSVRFPAPLAAALDQLAARQAVPRSDVVETMIRAATPDDIANIRSTPVPGAPSEKLTVRLSAETLHLLRSLAGEVEASDLVRRMVARHIALAGQVVSESGAGPDEGRTRRRSPRRPRKDAEVPPATEAQVVAPTPPFPLGAVLLVLGVAVLAALILWALRNIVEGPSSAPRRDARGQGRSETGPEPQA